MAALIKKRALRATRASALGDGAPASPGHASSKPDEDTWPDGKTPQRSGLTIEDLFIIRFVSIDEGAPVPGRLGGSMPIPSRTRRRGRGSTQAPAFDGQARGRPRVAAADPPPQTKCLLQGRFGVSERHPCQRAEFKRRRFRPNPAPRPAEPAATIDPTVIVPGLQMGRAIRRCDTFVHLYFSGMQHVWQFVASGVSPDS